MITKEEQKIIDTIDEIKESRTKIEAMAERLGIDMESPEFKEMYGKFVEKQKAMGL